ncbi:MAG: beta-ketoacyl-ACP synthase II [bacterium]|nr:beta-ketoacyl-ACP synthase II [bacterium]
MMARVVVTGMGLVSPVGNDVATFWQAVREGRSGIRTIDRFDISEHSTTFAGLAEDIVPSGMSLKDVRRRDRYALFAMAAADAAWAHSGLEIDREDPGRCGAIVGSGIGGIHTFESAHQHFMEKGPRRLPPMTIPKLLTNSAGAEVAIRLGLQGPNKAVVSACATGAQSVGEAASLIETGWADVMVAGGAEAPVTSFGLACFGAMRAISKRNDDPQGASRPFDLNRDGFVMAEGAGVLVLESEEHARKRGAHVIAELAGYAETCDAHHITAPRPDGSGAVSAMRLALDHGQVTPEQVDYFNAHGTSTKQNDVAESQALRTVFGDAQPPTSSTKSMVGHLLGAAGAVEAMVCALSIQDGVLPPSINFETPDPECDVNLIANESREAPVAIAMSNSLGFGGHNTAIVFRAYD